MSNQNSNIIKHNGKIILIEDELIRVKILSMSACASCHARGACSASDIEEKIVDVKSNQLNYKIGDDVELSLSQSLGFYALFLGYLLPLILVISMILILSLLGKDELIVGLSSLFLLVPYYIFIYLFRSKLKSKFSFKIDLK